MISRDNVQLALDDLEQKTHKKIGKEYSTIMNEFNENLKMLMDASVKSYKRLEMFIKDEVHSFKALINENDVGPDATMTDPLEEPSEDFSPNKGREMEGQIKLSKAKQQMLAARAIIAKKTNVKDDLYNKWDKVNFLQQDSQKSKSKNSQLKVKLENFEEDGPSEGYGSMEADGDEFTNSLSKSLINITSSSGNQNQPFKSRNRKVESLIVKLDKFVWASKQRRRLVGCKLCDVELRTDRIRAHIQKEHAAYLEGEVSLPDAADQGGEETFEFARLDRDDDIMPKLEANSDVLNNKFAVSGKRIRERPRATCTFCNKEMRKDGLKLHIEKVHRSQLANQGEERTMEQYNQQMYSEMTENDTENQSGDEQLDENNVNDEGSELEGESEFQDDMADDILSKFDQIRQHLEEVDAIDK